MAERVRIINGKGDWGAEPPTGADDHDLQTFVNDFVTEGGVLHLAEGDGLVEELDTPGMGVKVAPGVIYVENSSWVDNSVNEPKMYVVDRDAEDDTLVISSNPSGSLRVDLICQKIDKVTTPNDTASNVCPLVVVAGTPGGGQPATPADHELLAVIDVANGATSIVNADITDARREIVVGVNAPSVVTYASNATPSPTGHAKNNEVYVTALSAAAAFQAPSGTPANGNKLLIRVKDNGTARALTWNSIYSGIVDTLPATTVLSKVLYMGFIYNSTSVKWEMVAVVQE